MTLCVSLCLAKSAAVRAPRYTFDLRDAPTAAVFAMMLDGHEVTVMRHFPTFVTLRLTEAQMSSPPPDPKKIGDGDYPPISGWLARIDRAMGLQRLLLGHEREGDAYYVSENGMPNTAGADTFRRSPQFPSEEWHLVWPTGGGHPVAPPEGATLAGFRLAGVRWTKSEGQRRAILIVRSKDGRAFTRAVWEGNPIGILGLKVASIEPAAITLSDSRDEPYRLDLRRSR